MRAIQYEQKLGLTGATSPGAVQHMASTACLLTYCGLFRVSEVARTTASNTHCLTTGAVELQLHDSSMLPAHRASSMPYSEVKAPALPSTPQRIAPPMNLPPPYGSRRPLPAKVMIHYTFLTLYSTEPPRFYQIFEGL